MRAMAVSDCILLTVLLLASLALAWASWRRENGRRELARRWELAGKTVHRWPVGTAAGGLSAWRKRLGPGLAFVGPLVLAVGYLFWEGANGSVLIGVWVLLLALGPGPAVGLRQREAVIFTDAELFWYGKTYRWTDMERSEYSDGTVVYRYRKSSIACISGKQADFSGDPWDTINGQLRFVDAAG